jgi:polysaccharide export outer membrane protein
MKRIAFTLAMALMILALRSPVIRAQQNDKPIPAAPNSSSAPADAKGATSAGKSATNDPNYVIGAQDVLDINVWKEEQLTKTVPVRPDGKISLPLVNDIQASGLTPMQLATQITDNLKKFVTDPQVTVIVREINSQRVYLIGEAARPGAYPLLPGMTVLQALSSAGGFTQFANVKKIYVLRSENGKQEKLPFNYKEALGSKADQNIPLKAGDTIVIP